MKIKATAGASPSFLKADQIFSFDWEVALGDQTLTPKEFKRLLGKATGVVRFKGEYVYLDPAAIEQLRQQLAKPPRMGAQDLLRIALAGSDDGAPVGLNKAAPRLLDQLKDSAEMPLPHGLQAAMRPYQVRGYEWLARNARLGLGSVIADDMGLGKTLQVIALLLPLKERGELDAGRALVIVPTSLLTNWQKEVARFAPALSVDVYHGSKRAISTDMTGAACPEVLLRPPTAWRAESARLKALPWRIVVVARPALPCRPQSRKAMAPASTARRVPRVRPYQRRLRLASVALLALSSAGSTQLPSVAIAHGMPN